MAKRKGEFNFWNDGSEAHTGSWQFLDRAVREKIVTKSPLMVYLTDKSNHANWHHKVKDIYKQLPETLVPQRKIAAEHYTTYEQDTAGAGGDLTSSL